MMAALFLLMTFVVGSAFVGKRMLSIFVLLFALAGCWLMLWHHATDYLKVNW